MSKYPNSEKFVWENWVLATANVRGAQLGVLVAEGRQSLDGDRYRHTKAIVPISAVSHLLGDRLADALGRAMEAAATTALGEVP